MSEELKQLEELLANDRKIIEENYKEIERLNSIIKEVREYIESYINQFNGVYPPVDMRYLDLNKILEILDKEGK